MNCLPLMLVMSEIMQNSRDHISCVQHLEVTHALKKLKKIAVVYGKFSRQLPLNFPLTGLTCELLLQKSVLK